jgi:hypothetical protein
MTIEQKSELNRLVDPSITKPWQFRWQWMKLFLPLWIYILAFCLELALFGSWVADKPLLKCLLICLGPPPAVFLFFVLLREYIIRSGQRSNRVIQFHEEHVILGPGKSLCIGWENLIKFQFEPIIESPGLTRLILTYISTGGKRRQRLSMIAIEDRVQVNELIDYLQKQKAKTPTNCEITILDAPSAPYRVPKYLFSGMSMFFAGMFLLMHGGPMLLSLLNPNHHHSSEDSGFTPERAAKIHQFVANHFSSWEEFRHFFITLGFVLTVAGCSLLFWGRWLMNRKTQVESGSGGS